MSIDFAVQRVKMVDGQVRTTDVTQLDLLEAMLSVPREKFVPTRIRALSYSDEALEISTPETGGEPRYLMQASPMAKLLQLADIRAGDFVLIVGAGSGYSAAVVSLIAGSVIALESNEAIANQASETLSALGYDSAVVVHGDLARGYPEQAPFDVIFVEGAVDHVPDALLEQLRDGGRLVAVTGQGNASLARLYVRENGTISNRPVFNAAIKELPGFKIAPIFQF